MKKIKIINPVVELEKQCNKGVCNCKHGCQLDEIIITETILLLEYKEKLVFTEKRSL